MNKNGWHVVAKWRVPHNDRAGLASPLLLLGRSLPPGKGPAMSTLRRETAVASGGREKDILVRFKS
jgi:hypothetical protein